MSVSTHPLAGQRIADIVRMDARVAAVFADAGIGPRFLFFTVAAAARAQGADLEAIVHNLVRHFRQSPVPN